MRLKWIGRWVGSLSLLACLLAQAARARSDEDGAQGLAAQLSRHYRLSTAILASNGAAAIKPGEVLTVHREGIVAFAASDQAMENICPTEFAEGELRSEKNTLCTLTAPKSRRVFRVSEPVCVTAISVSEEKETVSMYLVACHGGRPALGPQSYYGLLNFRFSKRFLESAGAARVQETIDQVLSAGNAAEASPPVERQDEAHVTRPASAAPPGKPVPVSKAAPETPELTVPPLEPLPTAKGPATPAIVTQPSVEGAPRQSAQTAPSTVPSTVPQPAPPEPAEQSVPPLAPLPAATQPPPAPVENSVPAVTNRDETAQETTPIGGVSVGQTPEQVKAVLGEPASVVNLGSKVIYLYPNRLKIFFADGKVSKVQQLESNQ